MNTMNVSKSITIRAALFFAVSFFSFTNVSAFVQHGEDPPKTLPDFWNTGCFYIANDTSDPIYIIDGEDRSRKLLLNVRDVKNFEGTIFPWVSNSSEIVNKAFRFYSGNDPSKDKLMFYLFQNYLDNKIYYSISGQWDDKVLCSLTPEGRLNVLVTCDKTPVCGKY